MFSIRMRASKKVKDRGRRTKKKADQAAEMHISGAEGIYEDSEITDIVGRYVQRAMDHPRGKPDRVEIAVERIRERPVKIRSLPVSTLECRSPREAKSLAERILASVGISAAAIRQALEVVYGGGSMRGAALVLKGSGRRVEPDKKRGIRASRLGIGKAAAGALDLQLKGEGIDTETVREAIVLASKVASCRPVTAELCISDDPDYTTGYVSSRRFGYVRIPHLKKRGDRSGGRVFFIGDGADREAVIAYLQTKPAVVHAISDCYGVRSIDEIICRHHI